jgi:hypothetical protein
MSAKERISGMERKRLARVKEMKASLSPEQRKEFNRAYQGLADASEGLLNMAASRLFDTETVTGAITGEHELLSKLFEHADAYLLELGRRRARGVEIYNWMSAPEHSRQLEAFLEQARKSQHASAMANVMADAMDEVAEGEFAQLSTTKLPDIMSDGILMQIASNWLATVEEKRGRKTPPQDMVDDLL